MLEKRNKITLQGNIIELIGEEVKEGQNIPVFKGIGKDLKVVSSAEFSGYKRIIASVPSIDTPVCDMEVSRFDEFAGNHLKDVKIIFISMDLPFALSRFCENKSIKNVVILSDHRDSDFGKKFGVLIKDMRLLCRAVFVVDRDETVRYAEYVPEVASHPNYDKVLEAAKNVK